MKSLQEYRRREQEFDFYKFTSEDVASGINDLVVELVGSAVESAKRKILDSNRFVPEEVTPALDFLKEQYMRSIENHRTGLEDLIKEHFRVPQPSSSRMEDSMNEEATLDQEINMLVIKYKTMVSLEGNLKNSLQSMETDLGTDAEVEDFHRRLQEICASISQLKDDLTHTQQLFNTTLNCDNESDNLSKKARILEIETDLKLTAFNKLCTGNDSLTNKRESYKEGVLSKEHLVSSASAEIEGLLNELISINDKLSAIGTMHMNGIQVHTLQRHREILGDYSSDFKKILQNYKYQKEKEELLTSVRHDIDSYKVNGGRRMELYLKENEHLLSSDRLINDQINIAVETRDHLISQRLNIKRLQTRLHDISNRFPIVNSLVQRINFHKRRDSIIIGLTIFICTFLFLSYAFNR